MKSKNEVWMIEYVARRWGFAIIAQELCIKIASTDLFITDALVFSPNEFSNATLTYIGEF